MKQYAIVLAFILMSANSLFAAEPDRQEKSKDSRQIVSYGFKIGFDATSLYMDDIVIDGHNLEHYNRDSQVGYNLTLFSRFNLSKIYIQTGVVANYSRTAITVDKNSWDSELTEEAQAAFSMDGYCIDLPIQIGYNFIKDGEDSMALFCGPRVRMPLVNTYNTTFVNFGKTDIEEQINNFITSMSFGLNCAIGRTFFDIEYDLGLVNISKGISYNEDQLSGNGNEIVLNRRHGTFSFSIGMIF